MISKDQAPIKQISFDIIGFARDMANAENDTTRNTINFVVLKSRFTGKTGPAKQARYCHDTTRLTYHDSDEIDFEVVA